MGKQKKEGEEKWEWVFVLFHSYSFHILPFVVFSICRMLWCSKVYYIWIHLHLYSCQKRWIILDHEIYHLSIILYILLRQTKWMYLEHFYIHPWISPIYLSLVTFQFSFSIHVCSLTMYFTILPFTHILGSIFPKV